MNRDSINENLQLDHKKEINYLSFNQNCTCINLGLDIGFQIFLLNPFKKSIERNIEGGFSIVEILDRTNIISLVGAGTNEKYTTNKLIIWDESEEKIISEIKLNTEIKAVKIKIDTVIVMTREKIYLFDIPEFQNFDTIDLSLSDNFPRDLISLSQNQLILSYLESTIGTIRIKFYNKSYTQVIQAHESFIVCMSLNYNGTLIATASDKGTLIRIFNSLNGTFLQEVRRGTEKARIFSIDFYSSNSKIVISSERGTVHVFNIENEFSEIDKEEEVQRVSNKSIFQFISNKVPFKIINEWSFAQIRLPGNVKTLCRFIGDSYVYAVNFQGKLFKCEFDRINGGENGKKESYSLI